MPRITTVLVVFIVSSALLSGCATSPTGRQQLMLVSPESAVVESRKAYVSTVRDLDAKNKLLDDPVVSDRVQDITGRLVAVAVKDFPHTKNWNWSVAVIDGPETVNAWCMAGGRMAVYTGLFEELDLTDDEFAQIMGHEISHALANHTAERMSVAMATSVGAIAAGMASDNSGATLVGAALAAKLAIELPNSRTSESEADEIGIRIAAEAGYDPAAAVTLWQKMEAVGGKGPAEFMSTHPSPGNRAAKLNSMVPEMRAIQAPRLVEPYPVTIVSDGATVN